MRTITHLDENDIRCIIAKACGVKVEDVIVDCYMETTGYGPSEHEVPAVRAAVEVDITDDF